jgi:hypothetical protein
MEIFIAKNDQQTGPFNVEQIQSMITAGMLNTTDMAWHAELSSWIPVHQLLGVCPPIPKSMPSTKPEIRPPTAKKGGDLLGCVFFVVLMFLFLWMGVSGLALGVRSLGNINGPGIQILVGATFGVVFLSLAYATLLGYRHFHRRYLGLLPIDYKGAFGTKMKTTETVSGLLFGGGLVVALLAGIPFPILDLVLLVTATVLFAFSFDRAKQHRHLKRHRIIKEQTPDKFVDDTVNSVISTKTFKSIECSCPSCHSVLMVDMFNFTDLVSCPKCNFSFVVQRPS